jgi:hypothetical protein
MFIQGGVKVLIYFSLMEFHLINNNGQNCVGNTRFREVRNSLAKHMGKGRTDFIACFPVGRCTPSLWGAMATNISRWSRFVPFSLRTQVSVPADHSRSEPGAIRQCARNISNEQQSCHNHRGTGGLGYQDARGLVEAGVNVALWYYGSSQAESLAKSLEKDFRIKSKAYKCSVQSFDEVRSTCCHIFFRR